MNDGRYDSLTPQQKVTLEWDSMAGEWDDMAAGYAREFYKWLVRTTANLTPAVTLNDKTIVDFGCGTGLLTDLLRTGNAKGAANQVTAIDASSKMMEVLQDKIKSREWDNVTAIQCVLASDDESSSSGVLKQLFGKVDIIVASSVLSFVPTEDMPKTMEILGRLLKPDTGVLCHSDWPLDPDQHPDGLTNAKASEWYRMAGLKAVTMEKIAIAMSPDQSVDVFFGVARKP